MKAKTSRHVRIEIQEHTNAALDEMRGPLGRLFSYERDTRFLSLVLDQAVLALADRMRDDPKSSFRWPPRFAIEEGEPRRAAWMHEVEALKSVLSQAEQAGGEA